MQVVEYARIYYENQKNEQTESTMKYNHILFNQRQYNLELWTWNPS